MRTYLQLKTTAFILIAILVAGLGLVAFSRSRSNTASPSLEKVMIDLDHKVYNDSKSMRKDADVIVKASVLDDGKFIKKAPAGIAADGVEIPGLPETSFTLNVKRTLKGGVKPGENITVNMIGGSDGSVEYIAQDMPKLSRNNEAVFFLVSSPEGVYYPVAGGAGIAKKIGNKEDFELPQEATGTQSMRLSESTLIQDGL